MQDLQAVKRGVPAWPVQDLLLERWSPRAFTSDEITEDQLRSLFTAASWAASSYNEQPWRFLVGRRGTPTFDGILHALTEQNQGWAGKAPVLYASFAKKTFSKNASPNGVAVHDVGAASAYLALEATSIGLQAHGMSGFNPAKLIERFNIPEDFQPAACWAIGKPGDPETLPEAMRGMEVATRQRNPLDAFVFTEWEKPAL